ncbi:MAG: FG-GAP-like repeat-containing protein, partial [Myxococcota bacterium]
CGDPDCASACPGTSLTAEACDNGLDDDGDGLVDCGDPDCDALCDTDADGWVGVDRGGQDCDDDDASVHPGAAEVPYDGVDDDCDPATPDDDLDGDGFLLADDCDDGRAASFPGAPETCGDGVVNDCDAPDRVPQRFECWGERPAATADAVLLGTEGDDWTGSALAAAGDVDNDGDVDLYLGGQPLDVLLRNLGDRRFEDASAPTGAAGPPSDPSLVADGRSKITSVGDYDGDGWQDLVSATSTRPDPGIAVLHNRGDGTFVDATREVGAGIAPDGNPCAVMFTDYDNDGWRDVWVWNDRGGHTLLHNVGGGFDDLRNRVDRTSIRNPMGIDAADIDHDGDLDYYVSNIGLHPLLVNQGDGTFEDRSEALGTFGDFGWGLGFEDFDLDGWADLFVTQEDDRPLLVYRNEGGERFSRQRIAVPPVVFGGAAHNVPAAFGDVDGDGRIDVVWARTDGTPVQLLRNETEVGGRHGLEVRIEATPETGERGGIGARVVVGVGETLQFRDVTGGASRASQSALGVRFGLDGWDGADWVVVAWPDGRQRVYVDVPADQPLIVR